MASLLIKEATQILPATHAVRARQLAQYFENSEKCTASLSENFFNNDTADNESLEMACLCDSVDKTGTAKLIQHWVLSWRLDNNETKPSNEIMFKAAAEAMESLGFGTCPRRMAIHENTDRPHVHIAVARVDPYAGTVIKDSFTHMKAQRATAEIATRYNWETAKGNLYKCDENGEIIFNKDRPTKRGRIRSKALEKEKITGFKSQERLLNETLKTFCDENRQYFKNWKWGDLHKALALIGIEMKYIKHNESGGLVFSLDGKTWEKASIACPELSYPEIKQALGAKDDYRKARPKIKEILAEIRAKQDKTPQPLTETKDQENVQQPRETRQNETGNQTGIDRNIKDNLNNGNNGELKNNDSRTSVPLHGTQYETTSRTNSNEHNLQTGQSKNTGNPERTGLKNNSAAESKREISARNFETSGGHSPNDPKPIERRNTTTKRELESTQRTDRSSNIWNFELTERNNQNTNTTRESRIEFETHSQEHKNTTTILMEKIKQAIINIAKAINLLTEKENLKFCTTLSAKVERQQKFDQLKESIQQLQIFYDKKFITQQPQQTQQNQQHQTFLQTPQ